MAMRTNARSNPALVSTLRSQANRGLRADLETKVSVDTSGDAATDGGQHFRPARRFPLRYRSPDEVAHWVAPRLVVVECAISTDLV
jgi:hypothetical protein